MTSEEFISEFHNIEGVLVGERKRNVQKLLKNTTMTGDEENSILINLKPKTYLEMLMHIDLLIYLKKTDQLLEVLKNGNEACVSKIVKQPWFFKEAFNNISAEELVDVMLPSMSFSVKMKVLKKLCVVYSEEKMDIIFEAVLIRYGLFIATTVIQGCSTQKIEKTLKTYNIKLGTNQLKIIYNKQPNLINIYLDVHKQQKCETILDNHFLIFLAQNDPAFFWNLIEKHEIKNALKLGRRTTKKLIKTKITEIINEPKKYVKYFRHETLVRNLNKLGKFKRLYQNLFPKNIEKLDKEDILCNKLLKHCPKHSQYQLFTETLSDVLNENIESNLSCLNEYFLKLITDLEVRETLADLKFRESHDDKYLKYYKPEKRFTLMKEKINITTGIKERRNLLCILVESCAINKDLKLFEKVLKYFCERHRNDDRSIRNSLLDTVESNFKLEELNGTHWKYLSEIFTIQTLNKEISECQSKLRVKYIIYLYRNNHPEDDVNYAIFEYIKERITSFMCNFDLLSEIKDSKIEKDILLQAMEYLPTFMAIQKMEYDCNYLRSRMASDIFSYNARHPSNKIMIFENEKFAEYFRKVFQQEFVCYTLHNELVKAICKVNRNDIENEMLSYYWNTTFHQYTYSSDKVIQWCLKYDPLVIVKNIEHILTAPLYTTINRKIWPKIKLYSHLKLDNIVVEHCLKQINSDEVDDKDRFIQKLSSVVLPEHYIKIMESGNFIPTSSKLVIEDQEANNIFKIQRSFLQNLNNLKCPLIFLPLLVDTYCQGDFLQASLTPLYSSFYKCPENTLKPYLDKLLKNDAMSVKKHALNLACCVFDQQMVFEILNYFEKNKRTSSLQKCMFLSCLKYFSKNPTKELFERVIYLMGFLEKHDQESLNILHTVNIPKNYKPDYIQTILKLLETFKENDKEGKMAKFETVISSIFDLIDEDCIQKLPRAFCIGIIERYFLANREALNIPAIFPFVIKFLLYRSEKINNFDFVFQLLSRYKLQFWNNSSMLKRREDIYTFFNVFYTKSCEKEITVDFVKQFAENWIKIFTPFETFEEYILLNLLQFKKDSKELDAYSKKIVLFSEQLIEEFGQVVFSKFITVLSKTFTFKKRERVVILSNMLKFKTTTLNCILVIELIILQQDLFCKNKIRHIYHDIDTILKEVTDPKVQLYYNLYLKGQHVCT